ncbi:uncharacterized protein LOC126999275 isoform X2 [Eriocheir sinensis]|uniref:uncharacterized protein LOC126999275 isoform X2 n=1 Tax=Eriocheir sinensis TaxID=95602 RepID=UPI0021C6A392|nr:uncharacterized protein LOC126999275 isoform X2 [Eriocheir sinensis]XP_050717637.1 uncharacterized protein LOC126999275 isoform X2 [Eriocheir sinensis]
MAFSSLVVMKVVLMVFPLLVLGTETVMSPVMPKEGDEFLLECSGSGDMAYFLLHQKGDALEVGHHDELQIVVFQNATVFFQRVTLSHEGTHLCLRNNNNNDLQGYPAQLQVRPLPPDDLWTDVYKTKFVTGILAALVVAAMFALGCLVYQYRWQPRPEKDGLPILSTPIGYENPAMSKIEGDEESNCSTNM